MEPSEDSTANAAAALEDYEPDKSQHLKARGRSNSPPLKRVIVYDCDQRTVEVQCEKNVVGLWLPSEIQGSS